MAQVVKIIWKAIAMIIGCDSLALRFIPRNSGCSLQSGLSGQKCATINVLLKPKTINDATGYAASFIIKTEWFWLNVNVPFFFNT